VGVCVCVYVCLCVCVCERERERLSRVDTCGKRNAAHVCVCVCVCVTQHTDTDTHAHFVHAAQSVEVAILAHALHFRGNAPQLQLL